MFSKKLSLSLAAVAASIFVASAAQASFTAIITSTGGGGPVNLTGSSAAPAAPGTLQIGPTNVSINSPQTNGTQLFSITNFTATSNSPSATNQAVEVGSSVQIMNTSGATETLTIELTDDGFTSPVGANLQASAHGTLSWSLTNTQNSTDVVTAESVVNGTPVANTFTSNTLNANTSQIDLSTNMPLANGGLGTLRSPYSLGSNLTVTLKGGDSVNVAWSSTVSAVPEPTATSLMGMGGLGALLLLGGRRKIKA